VGVVVGSGVNESVGAGVKVNVGKGDIVVVGGISVAVGDTGSNVGEERGTVGLDKVGDNPAVGESGSTALPDAQPVMIRAAVKHETIKAVNSAL
jgi:hypothetical protein